MNKNTIEDEINAIRIKLYEETKHLTREENNRRLDELGKKLSAQYGFKIISSTKEIEAAKHSAN